MTNFKNKYLKYKLKYLKIQGGMYDYREKSPSPSRSPSPSPSRSSSSLSSTTQSNSTESRQVLYGSFDPNVRGTAIFGHERDCVAGSFFCGKFIYYDAYNDYLHRSQGIGLNDYQIVELISQRYPTAQLSNYENINIQNLDNLFNQMPSGVIVPILLTARTGEGHMVLFGKNKDGHIFLKDQQVNHLTQYNNSTQLAGFEHDPSLFIGPDNITSYLNQGNFHQFRVIFHEEISDLQILIRNMQL